MAPPELAAVGRALAERPEVAFGVAITGTTNLLASVVCTDEQALYQHLTQRLGALQSVPPSGTT